MPVRNAAHTLGDALDSVRRQTWEQWELLAFDDGSTDISGAVVRALAKQDGRVRLLQSSHVGIVEALSRICAQARGDFIARMDADDVMHAERVERQVEHLLANPDVVLCGTGVRMVGPAIGEGRLRYEQWINSLVTHDAMVRELFVECPIAHPTFMMRREAYEAVGGYEDHGWAEDYDLCLRFCLAGMKLGKVPDRLLEWRDSPGRLSMTDERYSLARFRALKRHYLFRMVPLAGRTFFQWGAGEVGKRWLREWDEPRPEAVVDINPRKIGARIHDVPVIAPEELPAPGEPFIVVAVGAPGARDEIREWLGPRGYVERSDFLFVA